jgi:pimeloyl-ACP methyl ester carboxylesterase
MDAEQNAVKVLSSMNTSLRPHVTAAYRTEETTTNYARQVLDFLSYDTLADAAAIQALILSIAAEYDGIASPALARAATQRFSNARFVQVQGANHYCLYD